MKKQGFSVAAFVAGFILLLPALGAAHSGLTGHCANCHTMHASQDGVTTSPNAKLLLKTDCIGCHAYAINDSATGRAPSGIKAPQIHQATNSLSGGYFTYPGTDNIQHNIANLGLSFDANIDGKFVPGSIDGYDQGVQLTCESCHDPAIGHNTADAVRAGDITSSYRMLGNKGKFVKGKGNINFEVDTSIPANLNTYDATTLNIFCATCHGLFHSSNQGVGAGLSPNLWFRHPTDVSLSVEYPTFTFDPANQPIVPMGSDASRSDVVMCISCHRPHGSSRPDMLRFTYADVKSGDAFATVGCESCHGAK